MSENTSLEKARLVVDVRVCLHFLVGLHIGILVL
jgi:hypothetical protein